MNQNTIDKWNALHQEPRFKPKYPSELVVQYVFRNFKRERTTKVLDLGCGAGRHAFFMANEGFSVYGLDGSKSGIEHTELLFEQHKLQGEFKVGDFAELPYKNDFFDGIICYGVLYYSNYESIKKCCDEMYRILKVGGKALIVVRSVNDYRYNKGKEVEKNTFMICEEDEGKCASNETGMIMHFFEKDEIKELFKAFKIIEIDKIIETHGNETFQDYNYIVQLEK